ncbi:hypothetical protein FK531_11270 [Rhodococcus spelaei]|uniref:Uncharacterized protein n=1 Tax=Rhodococcus spelaei TaxID=2546320 RepID=A0A541BAF2_9NOCA|nr:hypothetical protein [Rhodococcus spelaei]TQF69310.1 hypothetical protein FK531_11270 [Rhodococcus spelaei]
MTELRREGVIEGSTDLRAAQDLLELGIGHMSTPSARHVHPFQVPPVFGEHPVHADVGRSTAHPDLVTFTADLPADAPHGPVRLVWFNMRSLVGGFETVQPHLVDDGSYHAEGEVRPGVGVVVAGFVPAEPTGEIRPGFALVAE